MIATLEKHYSVNEIAEAWGVSRITIVRTFQDMPGVLKLRKTKSTRVTLRVPESLLLKVQRERSR